MSQKVVIGIVVLAVIIGGVWWYQNKSVTDPESSERQMNETGREESLSGRFADFITRGDSVQCTFSGTDPETGEYAEGTVFSSGERYYFEVDTVVEGEPVVMYMIQSEGSMYLWSNNLTVVPAMTFDLTTFVDEDTDNVPVANTPTEWFDEPEIDIDYSCRRWSPRADRFVPPANIEFSNPFSDMMEMMGGMDGVMSEEMMRMFERTE